MTTQSVILTALPNGFDDSGRLKVTVFVTPRLSTDGPSPLTLGDFEAFVDWPASVGRLLDEGGLVIAMETVGPLATGLDPASRAPDSATWSALLDPDEVGVHASSPPAGQPGAGFRDLSSRVMRSYPTGLVGDQILALYRDVATVAPTSFPPASSGPLAGLVDLLGQVPRYPGEFFPWIDGLIAQEKGPEGKSGRYLDDSGLSATERQRLAFVQAQRFYNRPNERDPLGPTKAPPPPEEPPIDFHSFVAFLGDYPRILRPLGLAVDLLVEPPGTLPDEGRVRVAFDGQVPGELDFAAREGARPWTNFEFRDRRFIARPRNREGDLIDGTLRLEAQDWFRVHQIDVDGSALKTLDFAANVLQIVQVLQSTDRTMTADEASLPALRTGGFVVARENRTEGVVKQLDQAADHEKDRGADVPADLFAEDVTRGYRPDVHDVARARWYSLTARDGRYETRQGSTTTPLTVCPDPAAVDPEVCTDEGFVKGASTSSVAGETDPDLYLHEATFGWDGWSLAAKRPGNAILDGAGEDLGQPDPKPPAAFPLVTRFEASPGSLPRLRFGTAYRFRARAVDLAGNSVPEESLEPRHETAEIAFLRYDPIPSPAVLPRRRFSEGESLVRMVIRSTLGTLPGAYVQLPRIVGLVGHTTAATEYRDRNERHLAAPKAAVQLVEWHSMFDPAIGIGANQADIDGVFDVAARDTASFIDPGPGASVVNPDPAATATNLSTHTKGQPLQPGEYVIRDDDDLAVPYLSDPISAGAAFTKLPGDADTRTIDWPGGWPDQESIRIEIIDGGPTNAPQKKPGWDGVNRLLTVHLRQAELVTVRLSCFPTQDGIAFSGILDLLPGNVRQAQAAHVKAGRHWMLTPFQDLTLVHAVEKPLAPPVVAVVDAGVTRSEGETFAALNGRIENHAKSTGRLDIEATWTEPIDDPAKPRPEDADHLGEIDGQGHVGDFLLEAFEDDCLVGRDDVPAAGGKPPIHKLRHEFGDTKHREVDYRATATTRFREYFPPGITNDKALITHDGGPRRLSVPSSRRPDPPDVQYVIPTFRWVDETYRGLPGGITEADLAPRIAKALRGVRGSTRLFEVGGREERITLPPGIRLPFVRRRVRKAGLRVYLNRPWYSSGAGELLAVVVPDQPYIIWPIDIDRGLVVEAVTRAAADEAAERMLAGGRIRASGGARLAATERLIRGVQSIRSSDDPALEATADPAGLLGALQSDRLAEVLELIGPMLAPGDPEQFITRWGRDPIWGSNVTASGPWIHQFPLRERVGTGLSLAEAPSQRVAAIGHRPQFDVDRRLWYCDIDIDAGTSYFPFARLGLARYQPASISGVYLSRVVVPEWAQLLPDRAATVSRPIPGRARVTVRGPAGYTAVAAEVLGRAAAGGPEGMALSRFAIAQVERLPAGATTDLAWRPAGDEVRLDLAVRTAWSDIEFAGWVPVPDKAEGDQLRVTLREYEIIRTDQSQADDVIKHSTVGFENVDLGLLGSIPELVIQQDDRPVRFRLVYADHLPL